MWGKCFGGPHVDFGKIGNFSPWAYNCVFWGFQVLQNYFRLFGFFTTNHWYSISRFSLKFNHHKCVKLLSPKYRWVCHVNMSQELKMPILPKSTCRRSTHFPDISNCQKQFPETWSPSYVVFQGQTWKLQF